MSASPASTTNAALVPPAAIELSFVGAASSNRAAEKSVKVQIPLERIQEWRTLFANESTAQIVYSAESNVFMIVPVPKASSSTSLPTEATLSKTRQSPNSESSSSLAFTTLILVTAIVVVVVAVLFFVLRKRIRQRGMPSVFSVMLASNQQNSSGMLEHEWSEWSAFSHSVQSACESPKRDAMVTHSNVLVDGHETPKRIPLIIYEDKQ